MLLRSLSVLECLVCGPLEDFSFWCGVRDRFFIAERSQSCPKIFGGPAKLSQPIAITENRVAVLRAFALRVLVFGMLALGVLAFGLTAQRASSGDKMFPLYRIRHASGVALVLRAGQFPTSLASG